MVQLWPMVGGGLLYDQHVPGHAVHGQPQVECGGGVRRGKHEAHQLQPRKRVLPEKLVILENNQVVPDYQAGWVGEECKYMGQEMLTECPDWSFWYRKELQEWLNT